jgi:hypothetical protein
MQRSKVMPAAARHLCVLSYPPRAHNDQQAHASPRHWSPFGSYNSPDHEYLQQIYDIPITVAIAALLSQSFPSTLRWTHAAASVCPQLPIRR